jgi:hypothetical protein
VVAEATASEHSGTPAQMPQRVARLLIARSSLLACGHLCGSDTLAVAPHPRDFALLEDNDTDAVLQQAAPELERIVEKKSVNV